LPCYGICRCVRLIHRIEKNDDDLAAVGIVSALLVLWDIQDR